MAFVVALVLACKLHYFKVVKNEHYGYPEEWIPSVSAVIGDRFPERNIFQLLMALAGIFRMALLVMSDAVLAKHNYNTPRPVSRCFWLGFARMWLAGFWIYFPSGDWNTFHDASMIVYLAVTALYHNALRTCRIRTASDRARMLLYCLYLDVPLLVYWFVQHKAYMRPGAYSVYALCEWPLIAIDVGLDYVAFSDLFSFASTGLALIETVEKPEYLLK